MTRISLLNSPFLLGFEQVERALDRLNAGKYGLCEDCEEPIATERLRFRPEATRCVACQGRWDRLNRRSA